MLDRSLRKLSARVAPGLAPGRTFADMMEAMVQEAPADEDGQKIWPPRWLWLAAGLILGASAVAIAVWATRPAQIKLWMTPAHPLSLAACAEEAHQFGYSISAGRLICEPGMGGTWYHAALVNNGQYTQVSCTATGYGANGAVLFSGPLPFTFGGIRGLFAPAHWALSFTWYLPRRTTARVRAYAANCSTLPYP